MKAGLIVWIAKTTWIHEKSETTIYIYIFF